MGKKRKLASPSDASSKRVKPSPSASPSTSISHPVLSHYYLRAISLRHYLLELLPVSSRSRRRKIASIPHNRDEGQRGEGSEEQDDDGFSALAGLLDSTVVGVLKSLDHVTNHSRQLEFAAFTQSQLHSTIGSADDSPTSSQSEIVDFAILSLFRRNHGSYFRPPHLLCHGFQRATEICMPNQEYSALIGIPGIVPQYPNKNVSILKNFPWTHLLGLLGKNGEEIMLHLLLDCGLFIPLEDGTAGSFYQLSGTPLIDLQTPPGLKSPVKKDSAINKQINSPRNIILVRRRMFYARAALNAKGQVRFGIRHIHVLNRYPDSANVNHTVHIMKYIFPRQFGLHNVFTSTVDRKETIQPFKDYTLREEEIARKADHPNKVPKRLRGQLVTMIQKLQKRHKACAYVELLRHYCPVNQDIPTAKCSMFGYATPVASVSAFCRAVLRKLIPDGLYGCGEDGISNRDNNLRHVDAFVKLGRFESLSLHEVSQGMKITSIQWLQAPGQKDQTSSKGPDKISLSEIRKRTEIFLEFIYYIFDSLLIPLIQSNFYVTESGAHRNRIFYFRHDVWRKLAEPSISSLKASVFEEVKKERAESILSRRPLGFGNLRLLPKSVGVRPIVNLRQRPTRKAARGWKTELGPSINSLMAPMSSVLNYEKRLQPEALGSALSNVRDIHSQLKDFKKKIEQGQITSGKKPLYFVKLDVQSCFDTIPQKRLMELVEQLVGEDEYRITKHVEVKPPVQTTLPGVKRDEKSTTNGNKPRCKFVSNAAASSDFTTPYDLVTRDGAVKKPNTVFVDTGFQKKHSTDNLFNLLAQHIGNNLVKIGKKFFRQKNGIPQGSVVSALLCNFFYGEHEAKELGFLRDKADEGVLMRLIDDYLFITTDKDLATRFLQTMLVGNADYGMSVSAGKTLANYDVTVDGQPIPRLPASAQGRFPYCGLLIDTRSLAISKDRMQYQESSNELRVSDTVTVESSKTPGQTFYRKTLATFRLHLHAMFIDTRHNSVPVAMGSLYAAFVDTAMKVYTYQRRLLSRPGQGLRRRRDCSRDLLIRIISDLIRLAVHIVQSSSSSSPESPVAKTQQNLSRLQITWLAGMAFKLVLSRKQTGFGQVLIWLNGVMNKAKPKTDREAARLWSVVRGATGMVQGAKF